MPAQTLTASVFNSSQIARYQKDLKKGAESLQIQLDKSKIEAFIDYLALFHKWNQAYNLSAVRNPDEMPRRHILDSLSVLPYVQNFANFVDVGTGAGLPGIPLAISLPDTDFSLVDTNGKKTRFLFQVVHNLALKNVQIAHTRVEDWQAPHKFAAVICRAYSSLPGIVESCGHLLTTEGKILAMKGFIPRDELREVEKHYIVEHVYALSVPGLEGERNLIVLTRRSENH